MPTRKRQHAVINQYLSGCPVDPAFTIRVDVEQNQTLHHVREDQLRAEDTEIYVRLLLDLEAGHFDRNCHTERIGAQYVI